MSLIVTGSIGIDTIETPDQRVERVPGGSCAYFAAAASFLSKARVVAAVGGDWPAEHRAVLESFGGLCLEGLEVRSQSRTFAWGGRYLADMNVRETIFTELGVLDEAPPPIPERYSDSRYVFLANSHPSIQLDFLEQFPDRRLAVADSMDLWINVAHGELLELLRRLDGLVINDAEAELLTGSRNAITAAREIAKLGPSFVVVKKGANGVVMVYDGRVATLPAFPAESHQVVDPTGAGDAFAGGMMGYLAAVDRTDWDAIQTALAWGTVTASFTIESFGLERMREITKADILERLQGFREAARVGEIEEHVKG